jgi:hypothetical protein
MAWSASGESRARPQSLIRLLTICVRGYPYALWQFGLAPRLHLVPIFNSRDGGGIRSPAVACAAVLRQHVGKSLTSLRSTRRKAPQGGLLHASGCDARSAQHKKDRRPAAKRLMAKERRRRRRNRLYRWPQTLRNRTAGAKKAD